VVVCCRASTHSVGPRWPLRPGSLPRSNCLRRTLTHDRTRTSQQTE
jgi:hypothetical protein